MLNKFPEPPPAQSDPDWPAKFTDWWWRKCAFYGVDPVETFLHLLEDPDEVKKQYEDQQ